MSVENLMIETFSQVFNKYFYDNLVIGQLAHTELKTGVNKGDEVDIIMPGVVTLNDYAGGNIGDAEKAQTSVVKVRFDVGHYVHFEIDEVVKKQIENTPDAKQKVKLAKEYADDAVKQYAAKLDSLYGKLYTRAGHIVDNSGSAIALTTSNAKKIFSLMATKFQRGDKKGHNAWIDGKMIAVIPPEYEFVLGQLDDLKYTESGQKKVANGFIGRLAGWDIVVSNNVASTTASGTTTYYPIFGIKGKTLAGGASKDLSLTSYVPDKSFNTCYKGWGYMGAGAPRADLFGCAKVTIDTSIS